METYKKYTEKEILSRIELRKERTKIENNIIKNINTIIQNKDIVNFSKIYAIKILVKDFK